MTQSECHSRKYLLLKHCNLVPTQCYEWFVVTLLSKNSDWLYSLWKYSLPLCRVIKQSPCTWWLKYRKLLFKVSSASLQTFIDTPNCVLEDRVHYSTVHIPNIFCDGHLQIINCLGFVRIHWVCTVIIRCTETFWSNCRRQHFVTIITKPSSVFSIWQLSQVVKNVTVGSILVLSSTYDFFYSIINILKWDYVNIFVSLNSTKLMSLLKLK
jgi:hypothetical protein